MNPQDCVWKKTLPKHLEDHIAGKGDNSLQHYCPSFACSVTGSTTTEFQHNDIMMKTTVQNDLRLEMALEPVWIVCANEK